MFRVEIITRNCRIQRRTSNRESRSATSNEQPSFRERTWANPFHNNTSTLAPTIQRWLGKSNPPQQSLDQSHGNLSTKAATKTSIWRHRNGPWDELVASKSFREDHQQQQPRAPSPQAVLPTITTRSQVPTISNNATAPTTTNVRSLRNYYTELQHQKQHDWRQRQSAISSTALNPRTKHLQSQQFYHHSHRSMDVTPSHGNPKTSRYSQPPLPPQRLASIAHPRLPTTNSYCIN